MAATGPYVPPSLPTLCPRNDGRPLRFLAGYRNPANFDSGLLDTLRAQELAGKMLGEACNTDVGHAKAVVRAAVLHLVWTHYVKLDITTELTSASRLYGS